MTTLTLRLDSGTRMRNTSSGNPQWQLFFNDGAVVLRTAPDAQLAFKVEQLWGQVVWVWINDQGFITEMEPLEDLP